MRRRVLVLSLVLLAGCGRLGFGDLAPGSTDGAVTGDAVDASDSTQVTGLSCDSLPATCGPTGTSSCCASGVVPGGSYLRSYDGVGFNNNGFPATVSSFRLDTYEVTVGRFRAFVEAGGGTQQNPPAAGAGARTLNGASGQGGWNPAWNVELVADTAALQAAIKCTGLYTWTDTPGGNEDRPINCITWYEAMAFCIWDGGYLPTEAEWNFAAAGGDEQRAFPWSSPPSSLTIDGTYAAYAPAAGDCAGDGMTGCTIEDLTRVGSKPAGNGRWGHADLGGNVWEWVLDWHVTPYQSASCTDCATLTNPTGYQVLRGGSFDYQAMGIRGAARAYDPDGPPDHDATAGVRCARPQ